MSRSGVVLGLLSVGLGGLLACEPLHDRCELASTGEPVAFDEVGPPGFAAADVLLPEGAYEVHDGGYDLAVTLKWAATATPRSWTAVDGDGDGRVDPASCPADYVVRGTLSVDSGDGRYDEVGSAEAVASSGGWTTLWVTIDDSDVRGDEVPGKELWLEVWEDAEGAWFGLTAIGLGGGAESLVSAPLRATRTHGDPAAADAPQGGHPGGSGRLPKAEVPPGTRVRPDQAGDGVPAVLDARTGEGAR